MSSINNLLSNDINKISFAITEPVDFYLDYKKCFVYNKNIMSPLQKIWLLTPELKLLKKFSYDSDEVKQILLGIAPKKGEFKTFIDKIDEIESIIFNNLKSNNKKLKLKHSIQDTNNYMGTQIFRLKYDNEKLISKFYDSNNIKLSMSDVKNDYKIISYVELTHVLIKDNIISFCWSILQSKVFPSFDFNDCLFGKPKIEENMFFDNNRSFDKKIDTAENKIKTENKITKPVPFIPSVSMLLEKRNSLKKSLNLNPNDLIKQKNNLNKSIINPSSLLEQKNKLKSNKINDSKYLPNIIKFDGKNISDYLLQFEIDFDKEESKIKKISKKFKKQIKKINNIID